MNDDSWIENYCRAVANVEAAMCELRSAASEVAGCDISDWDIQILLEYAQLAQNHE